MWQIGGSFESSGIISTAPVPTTLLDLYPNAAIALSLRKLRVAYAGSAVRIRRSSDNAEQDFGFSGSDFDSTGASAFIGGGSGFIVTWYDQSGNSRDVTQATAGLQPPYLSAASAGPPGMNVAGGVTLARTSVDFGTVTNATIFCVMMQRASEPNNALLGFNGTGAGSLNIYPTFSDEILFDYGGNGGTARTSIAQPSGWDGNPHVLELSRDSSDNQNITVDGASLVTNTRTDDISGSSTFQLYQTTAAAFPMNGDCSELVFWTTDLGSSGRTGARTNINNYYTVF